MVAVLGDGGTWIAPPFAYPPFMVTLDPSFNLIAKDSGDLQVADSLFVYFSNDGLVDLPGGNNLLTVDQLPAGTEKVTDELNVPGLDTVNAPYGNPRTFEPVTDWFTPQVAVQWAGVGLSFIQGTTVNPLVETITGYDTGGTLLWTVTCSFVRTDVP